MARKFFNKKVNKSQKTLLQIIIIVGSLIGIIICFFLANYFINKAQNSKEAIIKIRNLVAIEINSDYPDKTLFFSELKNVDKKEIEVSFNDTDLTKLGNYKVTIKIASKEYESTLQVVDTTAPILTVKDYTINSKDTYSLNDFIIDCQDNSKESCNISYFTENGNDYANYKEPGEYQIQIIASDSSGNRTIQVSKLTITDEKIDNPPTNCKYGNNEYDKDQYILAIDITQNGCGRDLNLYQSDVILDNVNKIANQETEKIQKEFKKLNPPVEGELGLVRNLEAVLNKTGNGLVGYTIRIDITLTKNNTSELVESYYLDLTGKRIYSVNKYNLP